MSLFKYFPKKSSATKKSDLSAEERRTVDECVKRAVKEKKEAGRYNSYTAEQRASIGKYAAENGPTKAARRFSKLLKCDINESTARKLKSDYLKELAIRTKMAHIQSNSNPDTQIVALPKKSQGRPLLLGQEVDTIVTRVYQRREKH